MNATGFTEGAPSLGPRFRWLRTLGRGGHGRVELAHDLLRDREVALKLLDGVGDRAAELKSEFRLLRDVVHPNLVAMLELVIDAELECIVLEPIDGVDFLAHVSPDGAPTEETLTRTTDASTAGTLVATGATADRPLLVEALLQLVDALTFLEAGGLVHGDLKPENILVERGGRVVVLDFGIARLRGRFEGRPRGTPAYMAPEQFEPGADLTGAVDRYALGILLYRALAGHLPFVGPPALLRVAKRGRPPFLEDSPLGALATALLHVDPRARPELDEVRRILELARGPGAQRGGASAAGHPSSTWAPAPERVFVGRRGELERLTACVTAREPGVAVLVGGPGLGKTALLDRVTATRGGRALRSRCYANESIRWNAIDAIVDELVAYGPPLAADEGVDALARLFPVLGHAPATSRAAVPATELVRLAARELGDLLHARGRSTIVIDDAQWADADSIAFLLELATAEGRLGIVLATRGSDARSDALVSRFASTGRRVEVVELAPLGAGEVVEMARSLAVHGSAPPEELLLGATGGVPFLVEELVLALADDDRPPGSFDGPSIMAKRLDGVGAQARRLLELLAVNGAPLRTTVLLGAAEDASPRTLRHLVRERFCRVERDVGAGVERFDVYHDVIRQRIGASLSADERRGAHAALARSTLASPDASSDEIATHLVGAGDPRARTYVRRAADEAQEVLAFDRAAGWLRHALELEPEEGQRLRLRLADCYRLAERHAEAAHELEALAREQSGDAAVETRRTAAEQRLTAGQLKRGLTLLGALQDEGALAPLGSVRSDPIGLLAARARVRLLGSRSVGEHLRRLAGAGRAADPATRQRVDLAWTVSGCFALVDPSRAAAVHSAGLAAALLLGDDERALRALVGETVYAGMFGRSGRARTRRLVEEIERLSDALDDHARALVMSTRAVVDIQRGAFQQGVAIAPVALARLLKHPKTVGWELMSVRHFYLHALYYLGRYEELTEHVQTEYRDASLRRNRHRMSDVSLNHATVAWLFTDGAAVALERAAAANAFWAEVGTNVQRYYALVSAITVALWEGDVDRAWRAIVEGRSALLVAPMFAAEGLRIDALHALGRVAVARAARRKTTGTVSVALALTAMLGLEPSAYAVALARLQLAGIASAVGVTSLAARLTMTAAERLRAEGLAGYAAAAESLVEGRLRETAPVSAALARVLAPGLVG